MTSEETSIERDALGQLARLIYEEMNVEPRRMTVAIDIARDQLKTIQELLIAQGLRRSDPGDLVV